MAEIITQTAATAATANRQTSIYSDEQRFTIHSGIEQSAENGLSVLWSKTTLATLHRHPYRRGFTGGTWPLR
jgi:hypothetical protein